MWLMAGNGEQALTRNPQRRAGSGVAGSANAQNGRASKCSARCARKESDVPVIVITAHGSIETAVQAMKEGAYDFITKPVDANHFDIVVRKALEREGLKRELELFSEDADKRYRLIVGISDKMNEAVETARKVCNQQGYGFATRRERHRKRDFCPRHP